MMSENTALEFIHDDDLADEALDDRDGGKLTCGSASCRDAT